MERDRECHICRGTEEGEGGEEKERETHGATEAWRESERKEKARPRAARAVWTDLLGDAREADRQGGVEKEGGRAERRAQTDGPTGA